MPKKINTANHSEFCKTHGNTVYPPLLAAMWMKYTADSRAFMSDAAIDVASIVRDSDPKAGLIQFMAVYNPDYGTTFEPICGTTKNLERSKISELLSVWESAWDGRENNHYCILRISQKEQYDDAVHEIVEFDSWAQLEIFVLSEMKKTTLT